MKGQAHTFFKLDKIGVNQRDYVCAAICLNVFKMIGAQMNIFATQT